MKKRWSLKNQNQGAALLAVLVILIILSVTALIITRATLINIEMKEVERGGKKNFYNADTVMDELAVGLDEKAGQAVEKAYSDVLEHYSAYVDAGISLQKQFQQKYMDALQSCFWDGVTTQRRSRDSLDVTSVFYEMSRYSVDALKDCIAETGDRDCLQTQEADASYSVDYKEGIFTLKNVKVVYRDAQNYETSITTDLVFRTPKMNFSQQTAAYMNYSLIADKKISVNARNLSVEGNVYAGADGIVAEDAGENSSFLGDCIITRGDIVTKSGTSLVVGSGKSDIWAENIETTGKGEPSALTVNGNCYVADDLTMDGKNSTVTLLGNYYGYNFQKNYAEEESVKDASFSSAMMINAKGCRLSMEGLNYLMLSGRAFLSKGSKNNSDNEDLMLGESVTVRSNQLAYCVPEEYLNAAKTKFTDEGEKKYEKDNGVPNVTKYVNPSKQIVEYHYVDSISGTERISYYLNFDTEKKANQFFTAYYRANATTVNSNAAWYATNNALILDTDRIFTFKGDVMYRKEENAPLTELPVSIDVEDWTTGGAYWNLSSRFAMKYKSLQLGLTESYDGVSASDVRITGEDGTIDKTVSPLFEALVDKDALKEALHGVSDAAGSAVVKEPLDGSGNYRVVVLVDNAGKEAHRIDTHYSEGIIIATGDVIVQKDFTGLILSGGTIRFADNIKISADANKVENLYKADMQEAVPKFADCLKGGAVAAGAEIGSVAVKNFVSYENWKRG